MTTRLTFPAPSYCHFRNADTKRWEIRPYTLSDVLSTWSGGGWFQSGLHHFDTEQTQKYAMLGATELKRQLEEQAQQQEATNEQSSSAQTQSL